MPAQHGPTSGHTREGQKVAEAMVKLYTLEGQQESQRARELLSGKHIVFAEIEVKSSGIMAFLERDLGVSRVPAVLTSDGVVCGLTEIKKRF